MPAAKILCPTWCCYLLTPCCALFPLSQGTDHSAHMHEDSMCSGVYYSKSNPGSSPITFSDPRGTNRLRLLLGQGGKLPGEERQFEPMAPFHHQVSELVLRILCLVTDSLSSLATSFFAVFFPPQRGRHGLIPILYCTRSAVESFRNRRRFPNCVVSHFVLEGALPIVLVTHTTTRYAHTTTLHH